MEVAVSGGTAANNTFLRAGALAALTTDTNIQSVSAVVDIRVSSSTEIYLGGLVGASQRSSFSNVAVQGRVESYHVRTSNRFNAVGGVVGHSTGGFFSNVSVTPLNQHSRIFTTNLLTHGRPFVGGLIGDTTTDPALWIEDVKVSIPIIVEKSDYVDLGGITSRTLPSTTILRAQVTSTIVTNQTGEPLSVGGLIGQVSPASGGLGRVTEIYNSEFSGHILNRLAASSRSSKAGGIVGIVGQNGTLQISNSSVTGVFSSPNSSLYSYAGGALGDLDGTGIQTLRLANFLDAPVLSATVLDAIYARPGLGRIISGSITVQPGTVIFDQRSYSRSPLAQLNNMIPISRSDLADSTKIPFQSYSSNADPSSAWNQCAIPYLSWLGNEGCSPRVAGALLREDGRELEVFFTQPITASSFDASSLRVFAGTTLVGTTGAPRQTQGDRGIVVSLSRAVLAGDSPYLQFDGSSTIRSVTSQVALSRDFVYLHNTSSVTGPIVSGLTSTNIGPSRFDLNFSCGGSCDSMNPYTYSVLVTTVDGETRTLGGSNVGPTVVTVESLDANQVYSVGVSVSQSTIHSQVSSIQVTTPRPIATISSLVVAEITATLNVGCTNCGAAPDSYTISATPQAGGAAITSNTAVIAGLSPETTYSFAVVIAYAGTTSASVNWQGNPVRTNPYSPVITSITPSSGPLAGGLITVTGSNFSTSNQVTFGGSTVSFTIVNGTTITFTAPAGSAGVVSLAVRNPAGTGTLPNAFTYVAAPTLTAISPALATTNGGTIVTLTGTELASATQVNLGSSTVSVTVVSSTKVRFVTPATSAGVVDVGIVAVGGSATLSQALEFTTSALIPVIASITPASGSVDGGTTITVTGQHFSGSYSNSVSAAINGASGSSVVIIDDSTLTFVSPAGAAASGLPVSVATGGGLGILAGAFTYTAPPPQNISGGGGSAPAISSYPPEILEFSTRTVSAKGGVVTVTGKRLSDIQKLYVGDIEVLISSNSDTSFTIVLNAMPVGTWDLVLINGYGKLTFLQALTVEPEVVVVEKVPGKLIGWSWIPSFQANSRSLSQVQMFKLDQMLSAAQNPQTLVCWGYTTSLTPSTWALEHARLRAQVACAYLSEKLGIKAVVRVRHGAIKAHAMRSSIQFWK